VTTRGARLDNDALLELLRDIKTKVTDLDNKFDCLRGDMQAIAQNQAVMDNRVSALEKSNEGRGARIGETEKKVALIENTLATKEKTTKGIGDNAKWAVGITLAIVTGIVLRLVL